MKKLVLFLVLMVSSVALFGCQSAEETVSYEDGRYRGTYVDNSGVQVVVQFDLVDNVVTSIKFRALNYGGVDYLDSEDPVYVGLKGQYQEAIEYLVDQDIREALVDLYNPEDMGISDIDTFTGATIRSNKIHSAIRDALNRGVYSY